MDNSEIYRFSDFTLDNFLNLLKLGLEHYKFEVFNAKLKYNAKTIILRHDIEFSVPIALKMAEMESKLGIKANYFIQLHSEFYNTLEKRNINALRSIIGLGHQVGLHFDSHYWNISTEEDLEKFMLLDKLTLEQYLDIKVNFFSFHNTNKFVLSCEKDNYAGMTNVYSKYIKENIGYCTDSTGYWRYEILEDRLKAAKDDVLQILIHDGMWQDEILPPRRRIYKVIDEHAENLKKLYDEGLIKFGEKNVDWEGEM